MENCCVKKGGELEITAPDGKDRVIMVSYLNW